MIEAITWENAHLYGDALVSQHRLRHYLFIEQQRYDVPNFNGLEYDQFDSPAAVYLVRRDPQGVVRASSRLLRTTNRYMLGELWPEMLPSPLCSPEFWESTRIGVDPRLEARRRDRYWAELLAGGLEFGLAMGIRYYIGIMPGPILRRGVIGAGMDVEFLGPETKISTYAVFPVRIKVSEASLAEVRRRKNIDGPVLAPIDLAPGSSIPKVA